VAAACGLARGSELLPGLAGPAERDQGGARVAFSQVDRPSSEVRHRAERAAASAPGDGLELAARLACLLEVADGKHDLDVGRKQRRTRQRLCGLAQRPPQRGSRRLALALSQAEERKARLRLPPAPAGLPAGLLGGAQLAPQEVDLAPPVGRMAGDALVQDAPPVALGTAYLHHRLRPVTGEGHDLGAVHEAEAHVGHHVGLAIAPLGVGVRPLAGTAQLEHALTERDRVAVDRAGDDRRQLLRGDGHHRLVHEQQAVVHPALPDERVAVLHHGERREVSIAEPLADPAGLCGDGGCGLVIAGQHVVVKGR